MGKLAVIRRNDQNEADSGMRRIRLKLLVFRVLNENNRTFLFFDISNTKDILFIIPEFTAELSDEDDSLKRDGHTRKPKRERRGAFVTV